MKRPSETKPDEAVADVQPTDPEPTEAEPTEAEPTEAEPTEAELREAALLAAYLEGDRNASAHRSELLDVVDQVRAIERPSSPLDSKLVHDGVREGLVRLRSVVQRRAFGVLALAAVALLGVMVSSERFAEVPAAHTHETQAALGLPFPDRENTSARADRLARAAARDWMTTELERGSR